MGLKKLFCISAVLALIWKQFTVAWEIVSSRVDWKVRKEPSWSLPGAVVAMEKGENKDYMYIYIYK